MSEIHRTSLFELVRTTPPIVYEPLPDKPGYKDDLEYEFAPDFELEKVVKAHLNSVLYDNAAQRLNTTDMSLIDTQNKIPKMTRIDAKRHRWQCDRLRLTREAQIRTMAALLLHIEEISVFK